MQKVEVYIQFVASDDENTLRLSNVFKSRVHDNAGIEIIKKETQSASEGAMSGDVSTLGAVAIAVVSSLLPSIINFLKDLKLNNTSSLVKIRVKDADREVEAQFPANAKKEEIEVFAQKLMDQLKLKS